MHRITLDPNAIAAYAATAHTMAATLAATATRTAAADPLLLTPAFGLIGADFRTAFTAALTTHTTTLTDLAAALTSLGLATTGGATACTTIDDTYAAALRINTAEATPNPEQSA